MSEHVPLAPFVATSGPKAARIVIVGEAWGESESIVRKPFVGESGKELWRMLGEAMPQVAPALHAAPQELFKYGQLTWINSREAWLAEASILYTNVFALRPHDNKIAYLCASKKEMPKDYSLPGIAQGQYIRPEFLGELARLHAEIDAIKPNIIIALGNTACWAILGETNIGSIRGTIRESVPIAGRCYKVLPSYHPAGVMRQWAWRVEVVADLMKAHHESATPDFVRPQRFVTVNPTLEEVEAWCARILAERPAFVACDTETSRGQITMVGFAPSRSEAVLVPFTWPSGPNWNYWPEAWQEERAREAVNSVLASPIKKIFQNGMYDFQYLLREGYELRSCLEDTMLLHHSVLPEMRKGLGYLGSVYTREPAWKLMRTQKADTEKRDE